MKLVFVILLASFVTLRANADSSLAPNDLPLHFAKVSDGIYRGARPSTSNLETLAAIGIKLDINLQGGDLTNPYYRLFIEKMEPGEQPAAIAAERDDVEDKGLGFVNFPLDDLDPISATENVEIDQVLGLLNAASAARPVYLHCEHGKDRTGLIIALYRIEHDGWSAQAAFKEWESFGHSDLNQLVLDDLDNYFWAKARIFATP